MKVIATVAPTGGANDKLDPAQTRELIGEGGDYEEAKAGALAQISDGFMVLYLRQDPSPMGYR